MPQSLTSPEAYTINNFYKKFKFSPRQPIMNLNTMMPTEMHVRHSTCILPNMLRFQTADRKAEKYTAGHSVFVKIIRED